MKAISMKSFGRFAAFAGVVALAACGGGGDEPPTADMLPTYTDVRGAICADALEEAQGMLVKISADNGGANVEHRLLEGYVQEMTGRAMAARSSYGAAAMIAPERDATLVCGEGEEARTILKGTVAEVTMTRVTAINSALSAMDVTDEQLAAMEVLYPPPPEPAPEPDDEMMADEPPVQVIRPPEPKLSPVWIHLASYRTEATAAKGWTQLENRFPALQSYKPVMRHVAIPNTGKMVRLGAVGFEREADAQALCKVIKRKKQYCMLRMD